MTRNYKTSAGHKYKEQKDNKYKWLSQQEELTPLERTKKPKVPLSSSTQTRRNEVTTPANLPPRKQGGWVQRLSGNTVAARTRKYETEYKSKAELLLGTAGRK